MTEKQRKKQRELLDVLDDLDIRYIFQPKTIFISHTVDPNTYVGAMLYLRDEFGYMIQLEID